MSRETWWPAAAATILAAVMSAGCGEPPAAASNVLLVLIDTLRSDRLSCYGYERPTTPRLDALAADGAIFLEHYTQGSHTRAAMPSLLYSRYFAKSLFAATSRMPLSTADELFQQMDESAIALPSVMGAAGRRTVLINSHPWLQPRTELARLYDEVHQLRHEAPHEAERPRPYASAERMIADAMEWLSDNGDEPFFMHLHLMDLHEPLRYTADAEAMLRDNAPRAPERWDFDERELGKDEIVGDRLAWLNAAYDGALRTVDRELGRLFDFLRQRGLAESTLVVVTSDHGETLFERRGKRGHGGPMFELVARVPLILHYPPRVPVMRVAELSESVDVLPTLVVLTDALSTVPGLRPDGIDLLDSKRRRRRRYALGSTFVRSERYKMLVDAVPARLLAEPAAPRKSGRLYDLLADPGERSDLWALEPQVVQELLEVYRRRLAEPFREFAASRRDRPAEFPFAISARHLNPSSTDPSVAWEASGWRWAPMGRGEVLLAGPGAGPVDVELRVPSGHYRLSLYGWGRLGVEANVDLARGEMSTGTLLFEQERRRGARQDLGEIEVHDARLHLRLSPDGEVMVRMLGFQPLDAGPGLDGNDAQRDRLLEALGYIN